jgi:hypothetical protein
MGWFSEPKDRIVRRYENNDHWVFYIGNGEWSTVMEKAHKFTLSEARVFVDSFVGSRVSIVAV